MKLVLLGPLLAQLLIHQDWIKSNIGIDLSQLDLVYWALVALFAAQCVYLAFAPMDIKKFPNRHEFIQTLRVTSSAQELADEKIRIASRRFRPIGSLSLNHHLSPKDILDYLTLREQKHRRDGDGPLRAHTLGEAADSINNLRASLNPGRALPINWLAVKEFTKSDYGIFFEDDAARESNSYFFLVKDIDQYFIGDESVVELLGRKYERLNMRCSFARWACLVLYFGGLGYFILSSLKIMWQVLSSYSFIPW